MQPKIQLDSEELQGIALEQCVVKELKMKTPSLTHLDLQGSSLGNLTFGPSVSCVKCLNIAGDFLPPFPLLTWSSHDPRQAECYCKEDFNVRFMVTEGLIPVTSGMTLGIRVMCFAWLCTTKLSSCAHHYVPACLLP